MLCLIFSMLCSILVGKIGKGSILLCYLMSAVYEVCACLPFFPCSGCCRSPYLLSVSFP
jgi:hypothetical protein